MTGTRVLAMFFVASLVVTSISTMLIIRQYNYFSEQTEKIVALQAEYKNYVIAVRRLLRGSLLVSAADEKKKDDKIEPVFVNRSPEYIKKTSLSFFKKNKMVEELKRIAEYEWLDYTDQVLFELSQVEKAKKKRDILRAQRKKRRASHRTTSRSFKVAHPMAIAVHGPKIFSWPLDPSHFYFSSFFGPRKNPSGWKFHKGLDMAAMKGTPVKAVASGEVLQAHNDNHGYGKMILLAHDNHYQSRYAHLDKILVHVGQQVERGTIIGRVGATGNVRKMGHDGSHLHFEVHLAGNPVNPLSYLG